MLRRLRNPATAVLAVASLATPWLIPAPAGSGHRAQRATVEIAGATLEARRISLAGPRPQRLTLTAPAAGAARVRVALVGGGSNQPIAIWDLGSLGRGARREVSWDARLPGGAPAPEGRYRFLAVVDDGPVRTAGRAFEVVRGFFPVRGPHRFGDGLGAGRRHQGQDLVAPCGTPVVAARGGRVREAGSDGIRGHYVVIDPAGGWSMAYLHLLEAPSVAAGDRVVTGQELGIVGSTGHSTGCHLHFELWSPPGYWRGRPVDPAPALRRWDAATGGGRLQR